MGKKIPAIPKPKQKVPEDSTTYLTHFFSLAIYLLSIDSLMDTAKLSSFSGERLETF